MPEPDLFESENSVLAYAKAVFCDVNAGAEAYRLTLGHLISYYEQLMRETRRLIQRSDREELEMNRLNHRLRELARELEYRATHDTLTGAFNRAAVIDRATEALAHGNLALIVLDIDHFKRLNDDFGHPVGDTVICEITACLNDSVGTEGAIGRLGGEEFAVLLPGLTIEEAVSLAERMRRAIANHPFPSPVNRQVTASFGISWTQQGRTFEHAYVRADTALYEAKRSGRNQVTHALIG